MKAGLSGAMIDFMPPWIRHLNTAKGDFRIDLLEVTLSC